MQWPWPAGCSRQAQSFGQRCKRPWRWGGVEGILSYPVSQNLISETGMPYTGIVVQYQGDGLADPHTIFSQRDDVKYQYGCFMESMLQAGMGIVLEPRPVLPPCSFP